ncbi:hypothetical protein K438DRAFT_2030871 [Mycena galopus ATCC 62051]|nr:hypothetical protein K438DRAFT_2030871 [Mycena galopus ATCC 62051]
MSLDAADVQHVISLIQTAYLSSSPGPSALTSLQSALRTPAAWVLIVPLLAHADAYVQFFGVRTAQSKIARGKSKLYGALVALVVRLVPAGMSDDWEGGWVAGTVRSLARAGAGAGIYTSFLAGAAEDIGAANLLPQPRIQLDESLRAVAPFVLQSITAVLSNATSKSNGSDGSPPRSPALSRGYRTSSSPTWTSCASPRRSSCSCPLATSHLHQAAAASDAVLLEPLLVWAVRAFPEYFPPTPTTDVPNYALPPLGPSKYSRKRLKGHATDCARGRGRGLGRGASRRRGAGGVRCGCGVIWRRRPPDTACVPPGVNARTAGARADGSGCGRGACGLGFGSSAEGQPGGEMHIQLLTRQQAEGDEDDYEKVGAPLGFWYLLQEALWKVPPRKKSQGRGVTSEWYQHPAAIMYDTDMKVMLTAPKSRCEVTMHAIAETGITEGSGEEVRGAPKAHIMNDARRSSNVFCRPHITKQRRTLVFLACHSGLFGNVEGPFLKKAKAERSRTCARGRPGRRKKRFSASSMSLDAADVQHAISLIQTAYSSSLIDPSALTSLQPDLRTPAA